MWGDSVIQLTLFILKSFEPAWSSVAGAGPTAGYQRRADPPAWVSFQPGCSQGSYRQPGASLLPLPPVVATLPAPVPLAPPRAGGKLKMGGSHWR